VDAIKLGGLTVDFQAGKVDITSISSVWRRDVTRNSDASEGLADLYGLSSYYATNGQGFGALSPVEYSQGTQVNQEVRAQSSIGALSWLVGGYYSKYDYSDDSILSSPAFTAFTAYGPGFFFSDTFFDFLTENSIKETAAFVNLTYAFSNNITLRAGARYFKYDTTFDQLFSGDSAGPVPTISHTASSESGVSPSTTLSYEANKDFTVYGTVSKGFRPGGGNFPVITTGPIGEICKAGLAALGLSGAPPSYASDTVTNFELGEKLRAWNERITLNSGVYLLNWADVQQPVILTSGCESNFVINGPKAQVKGAEMELRVALMRELVFSGAVSYNDAKFVQDDLASGIKKGDSLLDVPTWKATGVLEYRRELGSGSAFVRATHSYLGPRPNKSNPVTLPSQTLTDLRLGWELNKFSANLSVDNVFDSRLDEGTRGTICCTIPNGYRFISTNRPRSVSLELNQRF
jgi:outer membrane receptor protein involved in Fe transport